MSEPAQDIDSGKQDAGAGVETEGKPVEHVDVDPTTGTSYGHRAEPEGEGKGPPAEDPPAEEPPPSPPPKTSREEIYARSREQRDAEIEGSLEGMTAAQRREYDRMVAEAGGGPDPYAEESAATQGEQPTASQGEQPTASQGEQPTASQGGQPPEEPAGTPGEPSGQPAPLDGADEMVTVTVYGMQEQVPRSEVEAAGGLAAYQKGRAADEKLKRLTTYEASLRDYDRTLSETAARLERERAGQPPARPNGAGSTDPSPTDDPDSAVDVSQLAKEVVDAMYTGDQEKAQEQLSRSLAAIQDAARKAAQPATPAPSEPAPAQPTQPDEPTAEEVAAANAVFRDEFSDLHSPFLQRNVLNMVDTVRQDPIMRGRPLAEITREAAMRVRAEVANLAPQGQQDLHPPPQPGTGAPPADLSQRHQLKTRTVVTPSADAGTRHPPPPSGEQSFPSNSEVVQRMREARGQPRTA